MKEYSSDNQKTNKLKWGLLSLLGIGLIIYILFYTNWHFIIKTGLVLILFVNLIFDIQYFRKEFKVITKLSFEPDQIIISDNQNGIKIIPYSKLSYSIRKRKFESDKTEIELKIRKTIGYKTYCRLHIKNWTQIQEIENELDQNKITRTDWKPQTIWGKYWGLILELLSIGIEQPLGGVALDHQEKRIDESTLNPIKDKNNA